MYTAVTISPMSPKTRSFPLNRRTPLLILTDKSRVFFGLRYTTSAIKSGLDIDGIFER